MILKYFILLLLSTSYLFSQVDLNNATADELLQLNGIGKAKSQKILEYREANGCFKNMDELAKIEGVSQKIILNNRNNLTLGVCSSTESKEKEFSTSLIDVLTNPINLLFSIFILILGYFDYTSTKDLKSQIVSVGVLGTFVGIFIGLQSFNPDDIINSVNDILVGLKTAFFTSIVGMSVSTLLSIIEKFRPKSRDE